MTGRKQRTSAISNTRPTPKPMPVIVDREPGVALYIRVSTGLQKFSPDAQIKATAPHIRLLGMPMMPYQYTGPQDISSLTNKMDKPGIFIDNGVSAFKTQFHARAAASRLLQVLIPGDVVVVLRMDRLCRSVADYCAVSKMFSDRGVRLIICSPMMIDLGTPNGRMLARSLANLAEWESERKGERMRQALAQKKLRELSGTVDHERQPKQKYTTLPSDYRPRSAPELLITHKPGRIFLYIRCSHRDSADSGLGIAAQLDISRAYADFLMETNPLLSIYDTVFDIGVSAFSLNLRNRPGGRQIDKLLLPGDHVIFAMLDRGFRSVRDMVNTIPEWRERGVEIHFAADRLCMSDPAGEWMATTIVQFAQLESQLTSDRTKEVKALLADRGRYAGGPPPPFWKVATYLGFKRLVLDRRKLAEWTLIRHYVNSGMTMKNALNRIESLLAKRENRPEIPISGVPKGCKLHWAFDDSVPRDSRGTIFRKWTPDVVKHAAPAYDDAMAQWRAAAAKRMEYRYSDGLSIDEVI